MKHSQAYQPRTGDKCHCRAGRERDNCPDCEGTGWRIDFAAIRARTQTPAFRHPVFVQGAMTCIDDVNPATMRGMYSGETLEQVRLRYPGAEIAELEPWLAAKEKALCTEPQEISEDRFVEMLEVLPPQRWQRSRECDFESFELSEHLSGRVTSIFCRLGGKYFEFTGICGQSIQTHFVHCGGLRTKEVTA